MSFFEATNKEADLRYMSDFPEMTDAQQDDPSCASDGGTNGHALDSVPKAEYRQRRVNSQHSYTLAQPDRCRSRAAMEYQDYRRTRILLPDGSTSQAARCC